MGSHLAKMLSREANEITVIDSDAKRLSQLTAIADVVAVQGMPSSIKVMRDAGVPGCDLFIAVNPFVPQDVNVVSALLAKKIGAKKVTARLEDEEFLSPENKLLFKEEHRSSRLRKRLPPGYSSLRKRSTPTAFSTPW